jgi:hypothetical protein
MGVAVIRGFHWIKVHSLFENLELSVISGTGPFDSVMSRAFVPAWTLKIPE